MILRRLFLLFTATAMAFTSCKNNDNVFKPVVSTGVTVVNASADTLNFYLNGTRQNNSSNISPGSYLANFTVPAGIQNYGFKKAGNPNALFSIPLNLKDSTFNSVYVAGESADLAFNTLDTLLIDTAANYSTIRFVNASPNAGSLDVFIGSKVSFKSRPFKSSTVFLPIASGPEEIKIYLTGTNVAKVDTTITLNPNSVYTLFGKGQLNGKGASAFGVGILVNH